MVNPTDGTIYDSDNDFAEIGTWDFENGKPNHSEEEDDEEEIDVEMMEYEGETYMVNPTDGTIYDSDNDFAEIGTWDFDSGKPNLD
jgi:hypothetical protein